MESVDGHSMLKTCIDGKVSTTVLKQLEWTSNQRSQEKIQRTIAMLHHAGQKLHQKISLPLKEAQAMTLLQYWESLLKPLTPVEEDEEEEDEDESSISGDLWGALLPSLVQPVQGALRLVLPKLRTKNRVFQDLVTSFVLRAIRMQPHHTMVLLVECVIRDPLTHYLGLAPLGMDLLTASLRLNLSLNFSSSPLPRDSSAHRMNASRGARDREPRQYQDNRPEELIGSEDLQNKELQMNETSEKEDGTVAAQIIFMSAFVQRVEAALQQDHTFVGPALQVLCQVLQRTESTFPSCQVCKESLSDPATMSSGPATTTEAAATRALAMLWGLLMRTLKTAQITEVGLTFGLQALLKLLPSVIGLLPRCLSDLQFILRKVLNICANDATSFMNSPQHGEAKRPAKNPLIFNYLETANDGADNSTASESPEWRLSSGCYMLGPFSDPHFSGSLFGFGESPISSSSSPLHHCLPQGKGARIRIRKVTTWSGLTGIVGIQLTVMEFGDDLTELPVQGSMEGEQQSVDLDPEEFLVGAHAYFSGGSLFGLALTTNRGEKTPALGPGDLSITVGQGVTLCGQQMESVVSEDLHQEMPIKDELVDFCGNLGPQGGFATLGAVFRQSTSDPWMLHTTLTAQSSEVLLNVAKELFEALYALFPWFTVRFLRAEVASDPQLCTIASAFLASVRSHPALLMDSEAELRGDRWSHFCTSEVVEYLQGLSVALSQGDDGLDLSFGSLHNWMQIGLTEEASIYYAHLLRLARELSAQQTPITSVQEVHAAKRYHLHRMQRNRSPATSHSPKRGRSDSIKGTTNSGRIKKDPRGGIPNFPFRKRKQPNPSRSLQSSVVHTIAASTTPEKANEVEVMPHQSTDEKRQDEAPETVKREVTFKLSIEQRQSDLIYALTQRVMWLNAELLWEKQRQGKELMKVKKNMNRILEPYREQLKLYEEQRGNYNEHFKEILEQRKQEAKVISEKDAWSHKLNQRLVKSMHFCKNLSEENEVLRRSNEDLVRDMEKLRNQTKTLSAEVATLKSQLNHQARWKEEFNKQYKTNRRLMQELEGLNKKQKQACTADHVRRRDKVISYLLAQVQHLQGLHDKSSENKQQQADLNSNMCAARKKEDSEPEFPSNAKKKGDLKPPSLWPAEEETKIQIQQLQELCREQARTMKSLDCMLKQAQEGASARIDSSERKYATIKAAHSALEQRVIQLMKERSELKIARNKSEGLQNSLSSEDFHRIPEYTGSIEDSPSQHRSKRKSYEKLVKFPRSSPNPSRSKKAPGSRNIPAENTPKSPSFNRKYHSEPRGVASLSSNGSGKVLVQWPASQSPTAEIPIISENIPICRGSSFHGSYGGSLRSMRTSRGSSEYAAVAPPSRASVASNQETKDEQRKFANANAGCRPS